MDIKAVIGAGFGDEGKGLLTDYFCGQFKQEKVLNIRYNGGFQAGHTVVRDGRRHVFNGFGAGSLLENVTSLMGEACMFNGLSYLDEYAELEKLGVDLKDKFYVCTDTAITFMADVVLNKFFEDRRREARHGSCGLGIFHTFKRNQSKESKLTFNDVLLGEEHFKKRYNDIINVYWLKLFEDFSISLEFLDADCEWSILTKCLETVKVVDMEKDKEFLNSFEHVVFEGAQGLMLAMDNERYYPHLTPSYTGCDNIKVFLDKMGWSSQDLEVCYVTRSYSTRHGAGFILHEVKDASVLGSKVEDITNMPNKFQGSLRYAYLDNETLNSYIIKDSRKLARAKRTLAITHLDQTDYLVKTDKGDKEIDELYIVKDVQDVYMVDGVEAVNVRRVRD